MYALVTYYIYWSKNSERYSWVPKSKFWRMISISICCSEFEGYLDCLLRVERECPASREMLCSRYFYVFTEAYGEHMCRHRHSLQKRINLKLSQPSCKVRQCFSMCMYICNYGVFIPSFINNFRYRISFPDVINIGLFMPIWVNISRYKKIFADIGIMRWTRL